MATRAVPRPAPMRDTEDLRPVAPVAQTDRIRPGRTFAIARAGIRRPPAFGLMPVRDTHPGFRRRAGRLDPPPGSACCHRGYLPFSASGDALLLPLRSKPSGRIGVITTNLSFSACAVRHGLGPVATPWLAVRRDDRPFCGTAPPAVIFRFSRDRGSAHPTEHLRGWQEILQGEEDQKTVRGIVFPTSAYAGYNDLYRANRTPGPVLPAHRRSRAETRMHCVKRLGPGLYVRGFDHQVTEVRLRVAVQNGFAATAPPRHRSHRTGLRGKGVPTIRRSVPQSRCSAPPNADRAETPRAPQEPWSAIGLLLVAQLGNTHNGDRHRRTIPNI